jgi:uncharacterized protein with HEPN domain
MELESKKYLYDIQQATELLTRFTSGKSFDDFVETKLSLLRKEIDELLAS